MGAVEKHKTKPCCAANGDKNALRTLYTQERALYCANATIRSECADALAQKAMSLITDIAKPHAKIAAYIPIRQEADCLALVKALRVQKHSIILPHVTGLGKKLRFVPWGRDAVLERSFLGTYIPRGHRDLPDMHPDLMLVPLLAFDQKGHRLGYGGGYYDRTIAGLSSKKRPIITVGIAWDCQMMTKDLPIEAHDQRLDYMVTDKRVLKF